MKKISALLIFVFSIKYSFSQFAEIYPTNWWVGMKWNKVQLLVRGKESLSKAAVRITYPGITVTNIDTFENAKYLAVDLTIAPSAKPGTVYIEFIDNGRKETVAWQVKQRRQGNGTSYAQGVTSSDFIYLIMPDRFSNGDSSNDRIPGLRDQSLNRDSIYYRHGGDLKGIINHLDYVQSLGVTALWMTPVIENDMPDRTEHGYAFTNHYKIEPRLGGPDAYKELSDALHRRGMKLIQDAVYNHMGLYNFLQQDPPSRDWVHQWPAFTNPNYKDQTWFDPHGAESDLKRMADGWFTPQMPDLNQTNPYVANFLIQHAIWCVEEFGVDGWRIDTYIYVDLPFMNRCNQALIDEFPRITMFGEVWVNGVANEAYFTRNNINTDFKSNLIGVTDFQCLFHGIQPALSQPPWGVNELYQTVSNDMLYKDPMNNIIFLDNHDMTRFYSQMGEDVAKDKIGLEWLLTNRGIPEMYYGTEVLMKGISNPDGWVRLDFPGGWQGDKKNAFTQEGLTSDEATVQELVKKLGNFRKHSSAIKTGKMMQYVPADGVYVYFRYDEKQTIMCLMNTDSSARQIDLKKYPERTAGFSRALDVVNNKNYNLSDVLTLPPKEMWVLELGK